MTQSQYSTVNMKKDLLFRLIKDWKMHEILPEVSPEKVPELGQMTDSKSRIPRLLENR